MPKVHRVTAYRNRLKAAGRSFCEVDFFVKDSLDDVNAKIKSINVSKKESE